MFETYEVVIGILALWFLILLVLFNAQRIKDAFYGSALAGLVSYGSARGMKAGDE